VEKTFAAANAADVFFSITFYRQMERRDTGRVSALVNLKHDQCKTGCKVISVGPIFLI
jgi:hypothetical protein